MRLSALFVFAICLATPAIAQDWRAEVYGGLALEGDATVDNGNRTFTVDQGSALGLAVYRDLGAWEIGADLMMTDRTYAGFPIDLKSLSVMLNGRYAFALGGKAEAYVGAGIGAIRVENASSVIPFSYTNGSEFLPGAQLSVGARLPVGGGAIFSEIKYQQTFEDAEFESTIPADPPATQSYDSTNLVIGYAFSF